jgi:HEAT repeat protein
MSKNAADWIQYLTSEDKTLRSQAVRALSYMSAAAVEPLIAAMNDGSVPLKTLSEVFGQIGQPALDRLGDLLQHADPTAQIRTANVLASIADVRSLIPLILALQAKDERVREVAAQSLAVFSDPRASSPLIEALKDPATGVRAAAAASLASYYRDTRVEPALIDASYDREPQVRVGASRGLAAVQTPTSAARLNELTSDPDADVRQMAAAALRFHGGDRMVFERMKADVSNTVEQAMEQMLSDSEINEEDLDLMRHSNPRVRAALLAKVGDTVGENAVKLLLPGLNDINPAVRKSAVDSLARMGVPAVPHLVIALRNPSKYVRTGSLEALEIIADPSMVEPVAVMLRDTEAMVRMQAAKTLIAVKEHPQALKVLRELPKDVERDVREYVAQIFAGDQSNEGGVLSRFFRKLRGGS